MEHRLAVFDDLDAIMDLVSQAQAYMRSCGLDQWQDGYPQRSVFEEDIRRGQCNLLTENEEIAAVITVSNIPESCYEDVYDGQWLTGSIPYAVIHRSAVSDKYRGRRLGEALLSLSELIAAQSGFRSLRVDTHRENKPMRRTLEKCGFIYCGRVYLEGPEKPEYERVIYEKMI